MRSIITKASSPLIRIIPIPDGLIAVAIAAIVSDFIFSPIPDKTYSMHKQTYAHSIINYFSSIIHKKLSFSTTLPCHPPSLHLSYPLSTPSTLTLILIISTFRYAPWHYLIHNSSIPCICGLGIYKNLSYFHLTALQFTHHFHCIGYLPF